MTNIKLFQDKKIRSVWNDEEEQWYFSVMDVVEALTDSNDPKQYIKRMRSRDESLNSYWGTICTPLEMIALDGKRRKVQSANAKGLFRIIQSIPSPKAEPFKQWLAQVGYERLQEIENHNTRLLYDTSENICLFVYVARFLDQARSIFAA